MYDCDISIGLRFNEMIFQHTSFWEMADLLALLYMTFPRGVLGQEWYLIVSIPDLCLLFCFVSQVYIEMEYI